MGSTLPLLLGIGTNVTGLNPLMGSTLPLLITGSPDVFINANLIFFPKI
jgi:hypothetical protein